MTPSEKFAFSTVTFDAEYLLQIAGPDGKVLVTVGQPAGGHEVNEFHVWEGEGTEENGDESSPYVKIIAAGKIFGLPTDNVEGAWANAVQEGFFLAIKIIKEAVDR